MESRVTTRSSSTRRTRIPEAPEDTDSVDAISRIERTYERFLVEERGLSQSTVINYLPAVDASLEEIGQTLRHRHPETTQIYAKLDRDDADLAHGVLTVRESKFGKSRHILLHESTSLALDRHAATRDRLCPNPRDPAFFLNESGTRMTGSTLRWTFVRLSRQIGLRKTARSNGHGPRLIDMRHSFAVGTLVRRHREGVDVERHIPRLATWLGHAHVSDTYWYLSATPELMQAAAKRLDRIAPMPRP